MESSEIVSLVEELTAVDIASGSVECCTEV